MTTICLSILLLVLGGFAAAAGAAARNDAPPEQPPAEQGHGLTPEEVRAGWISVFDGHSAFGWEGAAARDGTLTGGATTTPFSRFELRADIVVPGEITMAGGAVTVPAGGFERKVESGASHPIQLGREVTVRKLVIRPLSLTPVLPAARGDAYKVIPHPSLPKDRQAIWHPIKRNDGTLAGLRGVGGPGAVELPGLYGNLVLQLDVRTVRPQSNGGVFFRCIPGDYLNGYEAQVLNRCEAGDPARPVGYSTGAIDDRQRARRLVSRDGEACTMTIVAAGPHVATWVNGYQLTDWADTRQAHDNPRQGLRVEPGTIQLQSHDAVTEVEFLNIRAAKANGPEKAG
jgi:hypothetical protein